MSYKLIRNCCIGSLVAILLFLGLLTFIVADRISRYDELLSENLSHLMAFRVLEHQMHHVIIEIQETILESRWENESILAEIDTVLVGVQAAARVSSSSGSALMDGFTEFQNKLRLLKAALVNYAEEVRYDPSADTTMGLEQIVMAVGTQSDRLFSRLAQDGDLEIQRGHQILGGYVKRARTLSFFGLIFGVGLGIFAAVILARTLGSPVKKLIQGTEELAKGNYNYQIPSQSTDEIGRLAGSFNKMSLALQEKEEIKAQLLLTQYAVDHASDAAFWIDKKGHLIYANRSACQKLGYREEELLQSRIFDIDPSIQPQQWPAVWKKIENEQRTVSDSFHRTRNGLDFPVEITADYLKHKKREYICMFARDCSERREAEIARVQLEKQLRQVEKVDAIGRLAGGVAHDLNNMLAPILGYSEMLMDDFEGDDIRRQSVKEISEAATRARDLVRQLLAFSRKQKFDFQPLDLNGTIEDFRPLLQRTIREDIELVFMLSPEIGTVKADISQIDQIIMNLAVNAADAMPDGGKMMIETSPVLLDHAYAETHPGAKPGEYVMLAVSDTGSGMDDETLPNIFEPFFSTKGEQGTGLGLATVYGIVKQHGGNVWVYSELGKGTTFKVYLPVTEEVLSVKKIDKQYGNALNGSERVLLVEDNPQVRKLADDILTKHGYEILVAENGSQALSILTSYHDPVDLLLTDVVMPDMNGKDLYDKVIESYPDIRVLYMSGYTSNVITNRGVLDEGVQFVQKPFTIQGLASKVREALDHLPDQIG